MHLRLQCINPRKGLMLELERQVTCNCHTGNSPLHRKARCLLFWFPRLLTAGSSALAGVGFTSALTFLLIVCIWVLVSQTNGSSCCHLLPSLIWAFRIKAGGLGGWASFNPNYGDHPDTTVDFFVKEFKKGTVDPDPLDSLHRCSFGPHWSF